MNVDLIAKPKLFVNRNCAFSIRYEAKNQIFESNSYKSNHNSFSEATAISHEIHSHEPYRLWLSGNCGLKPPPSFPIRHEETFFLNLSSNDFFI